MKTKQNLVRRHLLLRALPLIVGGCLAGTSQAGQLVTLTSGGDLAAAISQAGTNGTISLGAGTYNLSATATLMSGQTLVGATTITPVAYNETVTIDGVNYTVPSHTYTISSPSYIVRPSGRALNLASGVTIKNVSFTGSALWYSGSVDHVTVNSCVFDTQTFESAHPTAIEATALPYCKISNSIFKDTSGTLDTFIYFYNAPHGEFDHLDFTGAGDHIHIATADSSSVGMSFHDMHFSGNSRNPVEYQGGGSSNDFRYLWSDIPSYSNPSNLMGFTLPADQSTGTTAEYIVALARGQSNANLYQRVMNEFASVNFSLKHAFAYGVRKPVTVTNAQGTGTVSDCYFWPGCPETSDTNGNKVTYTNVNDITVLQKLMAMGRPGPFVTLPPYGGSGTTFSITATPVELAPGIEGVNVAWTNPPSGSDDMTVTVASSGGEPVLSLTTDAVNNSATVFPVPPGWGLKATATALAPSTYAALGSSNTVNFTALGTAGGTYPPSSLPSGGTRTSTATLTLPVTINASTLNYSVPLNLTIDAAGTGTVSLHQ